MAHEKAIEQIQRAKAGKGRVQLLPLIALVEALVAHLDYCGWGDGWERECSGELREAMHKAFPGG